MPPKAASTSGKQYDEVVVIALLMHLKANKVTLNPLFKVMVALDGARTESSFEHSLRAANKVAADLVVKQNNGQALTPADLGREGGGAAAATGTPRKRKSAVDGDGATPSKQRKTTAKKAAKSEAVVHDEDEDEGKSLAIVKDEPEYEA